MLTPIIDTYPEDQKRLNEIATSGWTFGHRYSWKGPQHFESHFSPEWQEIYERNQYQVCDPVVLWLCKPAITRFRSARWSEMNTIVDFRGIMAHAANYGLSYGAAFTRRFNVEISFMCPARRDREFTDAEMDEMASIFQYWVDRLEHTRPQLTKAEREVIIGLREGKKFYTIAMDLGVSESAIKKRLETAKTRLHAKTISQVVAIATAHHLV